MMKLNIPASFLIIIAFFIGISLAIYVFFGELRRAEADDLKLVLQQETITLHKVDLAEDQPAELMEQLSKHPEFYFHKRSKLLAWIAFIVFLCGFSVAAILPLFKKILELQQDFRLSKWQLPLALVFAVLFIVSAFIFSAGYWLSFLPNSIGDTLFLSFFGLMDRLGIFFNNPQSISFKLILLSNLSSILAIAGIYIFVISVNRITISSTLDKKLSLKAIQNRFSQLDKALMFFLVVLTVTVCGGVITSVINREAILQRLQTYQNVEMLIIPPEFVYLYGLSFSLFLFLIYYPAHIYLRNKGYAVIKKLESEAANEKQELTLSEDFVHTLTLKASNAQVLKTSLFILSPLISSWLNTILHL